MPCRHTVPDWHRFVTADGKAAPIFAACGLLTKDGERVADSRSIACTYWGHQEDCPLYAGPEKRPVGRPDTARTSVSADEPVSIGDVWPVRMPGAGDGPRVILIVLSGLSVALLIWAVALGLTTHWGAWTPGSFRLVAATAVAVSIVTHILALLRIWARR